MTPEREAEIREILSGNASPAHVRVASAAHDLLDALDAERKAHEETRDLRRQTVRTLDWTDEARAKAERERDEARARAEDLSRALTEANERLDAAPYVSRAERAEHGQTVRDLATTETILAHVRADLLGAEHEVRTVRALAESRLRDIDTLCADRHAWTELAEEAETALADVRQRCGGYPDSRVDGDGGIVAVVVRERDEARAALVALREAAQDALDHAPTAEGGTFHAALVEMTRLAATPATLAGQVRARVLREAAERIQARATSESITAHRADVALAKADRTLYAATVLTEVAHRLRALADEAERGTR